MVSHYISKEKIEKISYWFENRQDDVLIVSSLTVTYFLESSLVHLILILPLEDTSFSINMDRREMESISDIVHFSKVLNILPKYGKVESIESDKSSQPLLDDDANYIV